MREEPGSDRTGPTATAMLEVVLDTVGGGIESVHEEVMSWLAEPGPALEPAVRRLTTDTRGKSLRAALVLLFSHGTEPEDRAITAGALVELVHAGSLYHDDVIDEATHRRGLRSANADFGAPMAIASGDYLLARSSAAAASLGAEVAMWAAEAVTELCRGQTEEMAVMGRSDRTEQQYWSSVAGKTGSLMALACRLGAWSGGSRDEKLCQAERAGMRFGEAFQLIDDLLDVCGPDAELGRPPGTDLAQGVTTFPVILGLRTNARLLAALPPEIDEAAAVVAGRLHEVGALAETRRQAQRRLTESVSAARGLEGESALEGLATWLLTRADLAVEAAGGRR